MTNSRPGRTDASDPRPRASGATSTPSRRPAEIQYPNHDVQFRVGVWRKRPARRGARLANSVRNLGERSRRVREVSRNAKTAGRGPARGRTPAPGRRARTRRCEPEGADGEEERSAPKRRRAEQRVKVLCEHRERQGARMARREDRQRTGFSGGEPAGAGAAWRAFAIICSTFARSG